MPFMDPCSDTSDTVQVTEHVALLSRWMAADLYLQEVELLMFELSMDRCSDDLWAEAVVALKRRADAAAGALPACFVYDSDVCIHVHGPLHAEAIPAC